MDAPIDGFEDATQSPTGPTQNSAAEVLASLACMAALFLMLAACAPVSPRNYRMVEPATTTGVPMVCRDHCTFNCCATSERFSSRTPAFGR